jgi:glycosyltransferase involved in cell wall biosynthesis
MAERRRVSDSTFVLEASGAYDSPPVSAVREFLLARHALRVTTIIHPLTPEAPPEHHLETWDRASGSARTRRVHLPSRPPWTYPLDLGVPMVLPRADAFVGFNNLVCGRAIAARTVGRFDRVAYWAVDFVPDRFGAGSSLTRIYDSLDTWVCRHADVRFEVSAAARAGRDDRHGLRPGHAAPAHVVPMGAWLDRVPQVPEGNHHLRRVIWIGHMVDRQGVGCLIDAFGLLAGRGVDFHAQLVGRGPAEDPIRAAVERLGLGERIEFLGYVSDHKRLESILAGASVAVAPYDTTGESFTRYADPAKLKAYLAAGLPIITTDVPPNAAEVEQHGGGEVVAFDAGSLADAIQRALSDPETWRRRRASALALARNYDWGRILEDAFEALGFESRTDRPM